MSHKNAVVAASILGASISVLGPGCSSSNPAAAGVDPAEALTSALDFNGQATPTVGPLPEGTVESPTVTPLPGAGPMTITPGTNVTFMIPWQGGAISGVNIGFGGSKYFAIPVPAAGTQPSGVTNVTARLSADVCANLASTCHQIKCYEQVRLPDGKSVSKAAAMQVVLNCTGGKGCDGTGTPAADAGGGSSCSSGHETCPQFCSCVANNRAAFEACDRAALDCQDACIENNKDDAAAEAQCTCGADANSCASKMDKCMQNLGCPALGADCRNQFTGCK